MPIRNCERYLRDAVKSVLAQTFLDFELLLLDDGSIDGSSRIARELACCDSRIRFWHRPNRGVSATRNELLRAARGEWIAWIDADDVALPQWLERAVEALSVNVEAVAVGPEVVFTDPDGEPLFKPPQPSTHEEILRALLAPGGQPLIFASTVMRRHAALDVGGFRESLPVCEDLDLLGRLAEIGRLERISLVLYHYRQRPDSLCRDSDRLEIYATRVRNEMRARRGLDPVPREKIITPFPAERLWAWWALGDGRIRAARKNALVGLRRAPFALESWRCVYCAFRGH